MTPRDKTFDRQGLLGNIKKGDVPEERIALAKNLVAAFRDMTLEEFARMFINEPQAAAEYRELVRGKRACQKMSLLYNPHRLDLPTKKDERSIYQMTKSANFLDGVARFLLAGETNKNPPSKSLWNAFEIGVQGIQYANEFPPHVARDYCKKENLGPDSHVLDPCAGWGGRMIGVSVVCNNYTAYEPATLTHRGLLRLAERLGEYQDGFTAKVYCKPFERAKLKQAFFDLAITSPPYFDTERYSDEPTQSWIKFPTFTKWVAGFYLPLIEKTMQALKPGAPFILNIGSRKYALNAEMFKYCEAKGYTVENVGKQLLSGKGGLGKSGEGETFYWIRRSR